MRAARLRGPLWALAVLAAVAGANLVQLRSAAVDAPVLQASSSDEAGAPGARRAGEPALELPWSLLARTTPPAGPGAAPLFHPDLRRIAGRRVMAEGFVFPFRSEVGPVVTRCVVLPPRLASCCGPTCAPALEALVLVRLARPVPRRLWTTPGLYGRAFGRLSLATDDGGAYFTLDDAAVALYRQAGPTQARMVFNGTRDPPWLAQDAFAPGD